MTEVIEYVRAHRAELRTLDPRADLDDLEPLREIVGDARVVGIGENNHLIGEFALLRHRLLRFLVERCGFGVYCLESGFAEGWSVRRWVRGGPGEVADVARAGITFGLGDSGEVHDTLRWLRARGVDFYGVDLPSSGGSPMPALEAVAAYLDRVDPKARRLVDAAMAATAPYACASSALAPGRHAALDQATRDHATATLTRLVAHVDALGVVYRAQGEFEYAVARHQAIGALRLDQYLTELPSWGGDALFGENSSRDLYQARTVELLLEQLGEQKIVLALHNGHIQRLPFGYGELTPILPAGQHLAGTLGEGYRAIALTCGTGETTVPVPDAAQPLGFSVGVEALPEAESDSVEAAFLRTESPLSLLDLRPVSELGQRIRHAGNQVAVDVAAAFDAVVYVPEAFPARR